MNDSSGSGQRDRGARRIASRREDTADRRSGCLRSTPTIGNSGPGQRSTARPGEEKSAAEQHRRDVICEAARLELEGPDYCKHLDREGIPPSLRLREKGCPTTYTAAYRIPKWQKSIQDEKTRIVNESTRKSTSKPPALQ